MKILFITDLGRHGYYATADLIQLASPISHSKLSELEYKIMGSKGESSLEAILGALKGLKIDSQILKSGKEKDFEPTEYDFKYKVYGETIPTGI